MANDATLSWDASATGSPTSYSVIWTYNGTAQPAQSVAATAAQDASGYSLDFATSNPTITVKGGDVIGATVQAVDATQTPPGTSPVVPSVPPTVTEPTTPVAPGPPQNVTLVLS
jgi:hypothetical protein